ncbi:MAG: hypothetical protein HUU01_10360 [Saprospiraceae bacterium]|nr:hypothetical protein [Saprospiraceae bacterium]
MATKTGTRRRKSSGTATKTKVLGGKRYTKVSCSSTKTAAKKSADRIRASGGTARVVKSGTAHCVYKGPRAKSGRRKVATRSTGRRKARC